MIDNKLLLSCIIITYNQGKYLYDAIDSVLSQKAPSFELIIADDSSNDFDRESLVDYIESKKNHSLVQYTIYSNEKNVGTVRNINGAILRASGLFIKIFGGDDEIANDNVFASQVEYLTQHPDVFIVTGKSIQCDEKMNTIRDISVDNNNNLISSVINAKTKEEKHRIIKENYIFPFMTQSMCFRSSFFKEFGLYDEHYQLLEDTPMMNRIIDQDIKVGFQDLFVIKHRTKVGIASANVIYNSRSIRYYEDCKLIAQDSFNNSKRSVDKIYAKHQMKIASLRIELCSKKGIKKLFCYIKYLPNIVFYFVKNPQKALRKIKHRHER